MATYHGKNGRVYLNQYNLSGKSSTIELTIDTATADDTGFESTWQTAAVGIPKWNARLNSFWDDAAASAGGTEAIYNAQLAASGVLSLWPSGVTAGRRGYGNNGQWEKGYNPAAPVAGIVTANVSFEGSGVLDSLRLLAASSPTGAGSYSHATVDYTGSGPTQRLAAYLHLMSVGASPVDVRIEESPDDASWATLLSFTQATTATSECVTSSGSVGQYIRATAVTGGAASYIVGFHRD